MRSLVVVRDLFVLAIISIILNSLFILNFIAGYITVAILYRSSVDEPFSRFATALESIGVFATVACTVLTLFGSYLAVSPSQSLRMSGIMLFVSSILALLIHFIINIVFIVITVTTYLDASREDVDKPKEDMALLINACVLGVIAVFQLILLIYNSSFVCAIGRSLRWSEVE